MASPRYQTDPEYREKIRKRSKEVSAKLTPGDRQKLHFKYRYGITPEEFEARKTAQNGLCAFCQLPPKQLKRFKEAFTVDHDHKTGKVRSLLCRGCNILVGYVEKCDLDKVLAYIKLHQN